MLLSDSESCPEASPVRKNNDTHSKKLSKQETPQYSDNIKGDVTVLEETLKETSKQKSPIKKKKEDQSSTKKKKLEDHVKGGTNWPRHVYYLYFCVYDYRNALKCKNKAVQNYLRNESVLTSIVGCSLSSIFVLIGSLRCCFSSNFSCFSYVMQRIMTAWMFPRK